jgi:hypothetical protein
MKHHFTIAIAKAHTSSHVVRAAKTSTSNPPNLCACFVSATLSRRHMKILLVLITLLALHTISYSQRSTTERIRNVVVARSLSGYVQVAGAVDVIEHATVSEYNSDLTTILNTTETDNRGHFDLPGGSPQPHILVITAPGYLTLHLRVMISPHGASSLHPLLVKVDR